MVRAKELFPQAICDAMKAGDFCASNGVFLKTLETTRSSVGLEIHLEKTEAELAKGVVIGRNAPEGSKVGERIDFIGPGGNVLSSVEGLQASYTIDPTQQAGYVRARAALTRHVRGELIEYCAWAQPVFISSNPQ